jgi:hypothetical protein
VAPVGAVVTTVGDALAPTAEVTQPVPPLTDAGDGPAAAPGSDATLPSEQQPLTQPETETGLIDPQAGDTPPEDSNQPTDADSPPPPPDQEGEGEVEMPLARVPDAGVIAEAAAYVTAPSESGDAVDTGYFLPAPPDVRGHSRERR